MSAAFTIAEFDGDSAYLLPQFFPCLYIAITPERPAGWRGNRLDPPRNEQEYASNTRRNDC
jgi:hypothetical protein